MPATPQPPPLQFSLRAVLITVTLLFLPLAWLMHETRKADAREAILQKLASAGHFDEEKSVKGPGSWNVTSERLSDQQWEVIILKPSAPFQSIQRLVELFPEVEIRVAGKHTMRVASP